MSLPVLLRGNHLDLNPYTLLDLTTFTEYDPSSNATVAANSITITGLDLNEDLWIYKDFGADYFNGDFSVRFKVNITSLQNWTLLFPWVLANAVGDVVDINATDHVRFRYYVDSGTGKFFLDERYSGTTYADSMLAPIGDMPFYVQVDRYESIGTYGQLSAKVYSDAYTTLVDELFVTLHAKLDLRYYYATSGYNNGTSGRAVSAVLSNYYYL